MEGLSGISQWWGLSFPQTLLTLAVILVIVDVIFQSDLATLVAYTLVSVAVAYWIPLQPLLQVLAGLVAWGVLVYLHYSLWREFASQIANRVIAPTRYRSGAGGLVGTTGTVKDVGGSLLISVQGDLWAFESKEAIPAGTRVDIVGQREGVLIVRAAKEKPRT